MNNDQRERLARVLWKAHWDDYDGPPDMPENDWNLDSAYYICQATAAIEFFAGEMEKRKKYLQGELSKDPPEHMQFYMGYIGALADMIASLPAAPGKEKSDEVY